MKTALALVCLIGIKMACVYAFVEHGLGIAPRSWAVIGAMILAQAVLGVMVDEVRKSK